MPFTPLAETQQAQPPRGFVPLSEEPELAAPQGFEPRNDGLAETLAPAAKTIRAVAAGYPVAETAANLVTGSAAMPIAGLAGFGATVAHALGVDVDPGDVVHKTEAALTYQPKTELGQHLTKAAMYPVEKLAEAGQWAGDKTLAATDSPIAAAAVDTVINLIPALLGVKGAKRKAKPAPVEVAPPAVEAPPPVEPAPPVQLDPSHGPMSKAVMASRKSMEPELPRAEVMPDTSGGFVPLESGGGDVLTKGNEHVQTEAGTNGNLPDLPERVPGVGGHENPLSQSQTKRLEELRGAGNHDLSAMDEQLQAVPGGHGAEAVPGVDLGSAREQRQLRAGELPLGDAEGAKFELQAESLRGGGRRVDDVSERAGNIGEPQHRASALPGDGVEQRLDAGPDVAPHDATDHIQGKNADDQGVGTRTGDSQTNAQSANFERNSLESRPDSEELENGRVELPGQDSLHSGVGKEIGVEQGHPTSEIEAGDSPRTSLDAGTASARDAIDAGAHEAATSPLNDLPQPTAAQIESGNYKKGTVRLHGLDIAIENPKGSIRSGVSPEGKPWQNEMQHHYGYAKRSRGADGEAVDVFIGPKPESQKVFVIDQVEPKTGRFDEHKAVIGAESIGEAKAIYQANYEPGWKGAGAIKEMTAPEFKDWAMNGDTQKPVAIPMLSGKRITEYTDERLARLQGSELSDAGRIKVADEMERRAANIAAGEGGEVMNAWAPGANHVSLIDDARPMSEVSSPTSKPIRREYVLIPFLKAIDATLYEGRVKGKRLGFYIPKKEAVRIKNKSDLEVAAHELAHLIDDRVPEIRKAYADATIDAELRGVSYDHTNVKEGFAEFVRLYMTQPAEAAARAPAFSKWFDDFTAQHPYGPAIRKAQADMGAWYGQDALHRAQSKIGLQRSMNEAVDGFWDKFRQSVSDDLHGVMRMERDLKGKTEPLGAYETSRLTRAAHSIADGAIRYGRPVKKADGSFAFEGKGLEQILEPVAGQLDDYLLYSVGRSAKELKAQGREHLFTDAEIESMLKLKQPEFEKTFMLYQAWNRGVVDFAQSMGAINPANRSMWQRQAYMPFHRVGQPGEFKGAKPGEWSGIKALTGGTDNLRDILGNIVGNASMLIEKSIQNEARQKIADLADTQRGGGRFMVKIDAESRPVKIDRQQVLDSILKTLGIDDPNKTPEMKRLANTLRERIAEAPGAFEFLMGNQTPAGRNVVSVLRAGKPVYYEVADPLLYRSFSALDRAPMPWLTKWLGLPKRFGQFTVTMTPDFMVANIARDTFMGAVMSRAGFRPVVDSFNGMISRLTKDQSYLDYIANGGGLSSQFVDEARFRHHLEKFYGSKGIDYRTVLDAPDKMLGFVETLADAFEMSTRLGEYKRATAAGEHPRHAAYLGREVSTDFAMRGDNQALGFMYDTVMFLRPMVESIDRLARGVAHDPNAKAIAVKTGILAMSSMALYLHNRDKPQYADLPDWDKDAHWHFFVPGKDGQELHFRYPKIWEIGAISSIAERTAEKTMQEDPASLGKDMVRILGTVFSVNLMPQILAPIYEQAANKKSFTDAPIETRGMEEVQPFLRAKPETSETLKALGMATRDMPESMQVNPVRAEALLRGYFNTWALYGLTMADAALYGDKLPEKRLDQYPVIRRFYEDQPAIHTRHEQMFYDLLEQSTRLHGTLRALDKMGRPDIADEKERNPLALKMKQLERAQKNIQVIEKDMNAVRRADISPSEKRRQTDSLRAEKNALLKAIVEDAQP